MPDVQEKLRHLSGKEPLTRSRTSILLDRTPLFLGIKTKGGVFIRLIGWNTTPHLQEPPTPRGKPQSEGG